MRNSKRILLGFVTVNILLAQSSPVYAWGRVGHRVIAEIAERHLSVNARQQIQPLLAHYSTKSLADIATIADDIKRQRRRTSAWHYVDIPYGATQYEPDRDCQGHCIIEAIQAQEQVLKSSTDEDARAEALMFLVHLIGDLHQPLHCDDRNDKGGNGVPVIFPKTRSRNLHAVWDTGVIDRMYKENGWQPGNTEVLSSQLDRTLSPSLVTSIQAGNVIQWALESHKLADANAYGLLPQPNRQGNYYLSNQYYKANVPVVRSQLQKSGLRLAGTLNAILGNR